MLNGSASIRDTRKALGLSQAQLAQLAGVHQADVSYWERHRKPKKYSAKDRRGQIERALQNHRARPATDTEARNAEIRRLRGAGKTTAEIADAFGITASRVSQIAAHIKPTIPTPRGKGSTWTPEQDALAQAMRDNGQSASEIGKAIGKSRSAVLGRHHRGKTDDPRVERLLNEVSTLTGRVVAQSARITMLESEVEQLKTEQPKRRGIFGWAP